MRIKHHYKAYSELRKLPAFLRVLEQHGEAVAARAGEGYEAEPAFVGKRRGRVTVKAVSIRAKRREARGDLRLVKALRGGGG